MVLIDLQKEAPELTRTKGIILNWNTALDVLNVVKGLNLSVKLPCQYE